MDAESWPTETHPLVVSPEIYGPESNEHAGEHRGLFPQHDGTVVIEPPGMAEDLQLPQLTNTESAYGRAWLIHIAEIYHRCLAFLGINDTDRQ